MAAETDGRAEATTTITSLSHGSLPASLNLQHSSTSSLEPDPLKDEWNLPGIRSFPAPYPTPYMTAYMPQQVANTLSKATSSPDYQNNLPTSEAYILQSIQYQEFMKQYFNIMAAATGQTTFDYSHQGKVNGSEAQQALTVSLQGAMHQMQQNLRLSSPCVNDCIEATTSSGDNGTANSSPASRSANNVNLERKGYLRATRSSESLFLSNENHYTDSLDFKKKSDQHSSTSSLPSDREFPSSFGRSSTSALTVGMENVLTDVKDECGIVHPSEPGTSTKNNSQENHNSRDSSLLQEHRTVMKLEGDEKAEEMVSYSQLSEKHSTFASQNSSCQISEDLLIKKQMSEIDKQINRRLQNKNIRKSAVPFGSGNIEKQPATQSLNQLKDSFGLFQTPVTSTFSNNFVPQSNFLHSPLYPFPPAAQLKPVQQFPHNTPFPFAATISQLAQTIPSFAQGSIPTFTPPFPFHSPFFAGTQQQMAAAFLQQLQNNQQVGETAGTTYNLEQGNGKRGSCGQPAKLNHVEQHWTESDSWREMDARHKLNTDQVRTKSLSSDQIEQCTETEESIAPVWVMRDSYLKRIQREEDRNHDEEELQRVSENPESVPEEIEDETDHLLSKNERLNDETLPKKNPKKEVIVHEPAVLIEGVLFRARYLGSTQLICEGRPTKTSRMLQAQEAVARVKAPDGEMQPSTDIDLFISTEKIMVLNTDLQDILMDHALRTISYIADIGDLVVLMARRISQSASEEDCNAEGLDSVQRTPKVICHVFESEEASFIAQSIGQAFQVAYVEFLRANGIDDPSYLREIDYQEVLNSQELLGEELEMFSRKETQKDVVVPKKAGEALGVVVVESGWGSMLPTVVIANLQPGGAASRCNQLNIGDQIIAINGISLVGLPLASAQRTIKGARSSTAVKLTVVSTPPVVEVRIKRPDTKYQLGFSVQNGVICSLLRGGIAERGGIRVGHRIIEINGHSVVAVPHEKIVKMLATAIGEIHMKTMPTSMFRLLTGQEVPNYI